MKDIWDLQRALPINVEAGDNSADFRLKLAAHLDAPKGSEKYIALRKEGEIASAGQNIVECLRYFEMAQAARELVLLVDQGGLLDDEGELVLDFRDLLLAIFENKILRTMIISRRKPMPIELEPGLVLPNVRINQLTDVSTHILLQQLQAREQLELSQRELNTLVERVRGYPPAAYYAIGLIKDYGRELILRDSRPIIDFRETAFLHFLEKENKFSETQRAILGLLPHFDSLPLPVLGKTLRVDQITIDRDAIRLLDMALLNIDDYGFYSVSDPVREVAHRVFGKITAPYETLAQAIDDYLAQRRSDDQEDMEPLPLLRARFKAYVLAGRGSRDLFYIASDLMHLQQTFYHHQDYEQSIKFGRQALEIRRKEPNALRYLARALIQLERYSEAVEIIDLVKTLSLKEAKFLEGFLFRKRGDTGRAVPAYREALALGMKGVAIHRELGQCLFEEGELKEARRHLQQALEADPENKFVLDYNIQVAIAEGRFQEARDLLPQLEGVEEKMRLLHRLSTLEFAMANFSAAFKAAEQAVKSDSRPHFEVIAQYVKTAIRDGKLEAAQRGLGMLRTRFSGIRNDIQNGLWARFYLAKGQMKDAEDSWRKIVRKDTGIHQRIREDILEAMLRDRALLAAERTSLQAELNNLREQEKPKIAEALEADLA